MDVLSRALIPIDPHQRLAVLDEFPERVTMLVRSLDEPLALAKSECLGRAPTPCTTAQRLAEKAPDQYKELRHQRSAA